MPATVPPSLNEEYTMPRTEALLAHKIGANLSTLSEDPLLSPGFQALLRALRSRWKGAQASAATCNSEARSLWHRSPEALQ